MTQFQRTFTVAREDIDEQGHVNNVAFVGWVQDISVAHWLAVTTTEQQEKFGWIMIRHEIDYKRQAFENEQIRMITWVGKWTKVTCERFVEIYRDVDLLANSRTIWCMLDRQTFRPKRIFAELKELF